VSPKAKTPESAKGPELPGRPAQLVNASGPRIPLTSPPRRRRQPPQKTRTSRRNCLLPPSFPGVPPVGVLRPGPVPRLLAPGASGPAAAAWLSPSWLAVRASPQAGLGPRRHQAAGGPPGHPCPAPEPVPEGGDDAVAVEAEEAHQRAHNPGTAHPARAAPAADAESPTAPDTPAAAGTLAQRATRPVGRQNPGPPALQGMGQPGARGPQPPASNVSSPSAPPGPAQGRHAGAGQRQPPDDRAQATRPPCGPSAVAPAAAGGPASTLPEAARAPTWPPGGPPPPMPRSPREHRVSAALQTLPAALLLPWEVPRAAQAAPRAAVALRR
jgi:hypothetical protein